MPVNAATRNKVTIFIAYIAFQQVSDFDLITQDDFDTYRITQYLNPTAPSTSGFPTAATTPKARDLVADFKRGIRRNATLFPILKDSKNWDSYLQTTVAQAKAQGLWEVFDTTYKPNGPDEEAVFLEQKKYVFAVFDRTLRTDKGKSIVRHHIGTCDVQAVWTEMRDHHENAKGAQMMAHKLLSYITSARWEEWKGNSTSFILHWMDQV